MDGFINLYKPKNITSSEAARKIKSITGSKKAGHFGTLDPAGTGVLPVALNKATKLFEYYLNNNKTYKTIFTFSKTTDTLDGEGIITKSGFPVPTEAEIKKVIPNLSGFQLQKPPIYSAKNINGERAYKLARKGISFNIKPKKIRIFEINYIKKTDEFSYMFEIRCSSGTYIRSLARDMAAELDTYAYMSLIERTSTGYFNLNNSTTFEEIEEHGYEPYLVTIEQALSNLKKIIIDEKYYDKLKNGVTINLDSKISNDFLLYCKDELMGVAFIADGLLKFRIKL